MTSWIYCTKQEKENSWIQWRDSIYTGKHRIITKLTTKIQSNRTPSLMLLTPMVP
jgi:hypothetical protein